MKRLFDKIDSIELQGVSKSYGGRHAVKDVNLDVEGGELLVLIGPSGSGKTTLMRTINRLVEPDTGTILINDKDVENFDPVELRKNIGYVIQQIGLFPHMTIEDNIALLPRIEGIPKEERRKRVKELLKLVDLEPESFMSRYPRQLSGGQQQRVGLARALSMNPYLILMDEPFGALDPMLRKQLQEEFLKVKKKLGRTIVFVTHDIDEAFTVGDRIGIMRDGELIQVDEPGELMKNPRDDFVEDLVDVERLKCLQGRK